MCSCVYSLSPPKQWSRFYETVRVGTLGPQESFPFKIKKIIIQKTKKKKEEMN